MKLIDSNGNEILKDVVLWSGSHFDYEHANLVLKEDALKFKELIVILNDRAVIMPIVNNKIVNSGAPADYRSIVCNVTNYIQSTKTLNLMTAIWTNPQNNGSTTLTAIYGRY